MEKGMVHIYSGEGHGKSSAALGRALQAANLGKHVVIIQFLKGLNESEFVKQLEPTIKIFRFEKSDGEFENLTDEMKLEEAKNIINGLNFAKKVLTTGECDLLILDEVLGLVDKGIISVEELTKVLEAKTDSVDVIMTGIQLKEEMKALADEISIIETLN